MCNSLGCSPLIWPRTPTSAPSDLLILLIWNDARGYGQVGYHAHWHISPSSELHAYAMSTLIDSQWRKLEKGKKRGGLGGMKILVAQTLHCFAICWKLWQTTDFSIPYPVILYLGSPTSLYIIFNKSRRSPCSWREYLRLWMARLRELLWIRNLRQQTIQGLSQNCTRSCANFLEVIWVNSMTDKTATQHGTA